MESLLTCFLVTILVIHSGNASLVISVDTDPILPGNNVTLTCISSDSVAMFVWQHSSGGLIAINNQIYWILTPVMIANMDKQSSLTIIGFKNNLDGTWECSIGMESTSVYLSVDEGMDILDSKSLLAHC
ncbi:uncharacterized protein LOC117119386 [Anneissia japonica]|uniref:uncharacterized protein LOC117119386 n=1 Tax=Anneissia japonica TaxID=1529436 RepID=UPI0014257E11|nr:uncharacterized protein LOC117119386 [Anneissia japonica]